MSIIKVENLVKRYGTITAVDDISFEVEKGTIFGFLGPNGAGKTTTINVLCTLASPTSGKTSINGFDCMKQSSDVRKSIGIVFQDTTLDKDLTAYENLAFHAYLYSVKRKEIKGRVEHALNFAGLYDRKDDVVKKFSGGMKRRLEVARGLIHRPKVLFLDEPTLGLDPQSRTNLWESITKLPREHGVTVFMTTHYMEEAEVCDRIAIIDNGRIIAEGTPAELKKSVGEEVVYIKTHNPEKTCEEIRKLFGLEAETKNGEVAVAAENAEALVPKLIRGLPELVLSVRVEHPTINDVFLKLTGKALRDRELSGMGTIKEEVRAFRRRQH